MKRTCTPWTLIRKSSGAAVWQTECGYISAEILLGTGTYNIYGWWGGKQKYLLRGGGSTERGAKSAAARLLRNPRLLARRLRRMGEAELAERVEREVAL